MRKILWRLEIKFLTILLLPVVIATVVTSMAFGIATYSDMMTEFRKEQSAIVAETADAVAQPMWNLDRPNIMRLLDAVVDGTEVRQAIILDPEEREYIKIGEAPPQGSEVASTPIFYSVSGQKQTLGVLIIAFDTSQIRNAIAKQVFRDSVYLLLLVLAIVVGAYITNKWVVRRPLEALIEAIHKSVKTNTYEEAGEWRSKDELGEIITAYNHMVQKISSEEIALRKAVDEAEQERERAEKMARTDPLTGMNNRRALFDYGRMVEEQSHRSGRAYSIIMIDIDHFKSVNDTHGHDVGDNLLCEVAVAISSVVRAIDIPGRIGGEEFAVVLPETKADEALNLAERLRTAVKAISLPGEGLDLSVTASLGVAESKGTTERMEKIMSFADTALYRSKNSGRDQVSFYED